MEDSKIIEQLFLVVTELDARECSNNCPTCLRELSWKELCDMGINLFKQLSLPRELKNGDIGNMNDKVNLREIAECIVEFLENCGFDDISDSSGYFIVREFGDGTDRAVDVHKSTNDGNPHYILYCSYENEDFDYMYTDDLSADGLLSKLEEFYSA